MSIEGHKEIQRTFKVVKSYLKRFFEVLIRGDTREENLYPCLGASTGGKVAI